MATSPATWSPYVAQLTELPGIRKATVELVEASDPAPVWDGSIDITTTTGRTRLLVEEKGGVLNAAMAERVLSRLPRYPPQGWILFAPYITPRLAEQLAEHHVNFMDRAGNCHLELPPEMLIHIVGRRRRPVEARSRLGANGYRVLLALLARPDLADAPVRDLAQAAGISKSTAATTLQVLERMGTLHKTRSGRVLESAHILDRWVSGYTELLRPALVLARYQPADPDPARLEERGAEALNRLGVRWALTGGAAAQRLTGHYRGDTTMVHIEHPVPELVQELKLAPSAEGSLTVLLAPGPLVFEAAPKPGVAPAPLVYAELLHSGGERAREAAEKVRARYMSKFA